MSPPETQDTLPPLDHANRLALGARQRPRRHDRELDGEADRLLEALGDAPAEAGDHGVLGVEATAALHELGPRLDVHLEGRQGRAPVHDELVVGHELLDLEECPFHLGG